MPDAVEPDIRVSKIDLASAFLTIALVSQSTEIESNTKVLEIWDSLKKRINLEDDDLNIIASILASGLIMNRTIKLNYDD